MPTDRYDDTRQSAASPNPTAGAANALRHAHEAARRAYKRGATVSRAFNWLHIFNHPSPTSRARSVEGWNREVGTRIGAAAASVEDIGPQLISAMQGGVLQIDGEGEGETAPLPPSSGQHDGSGRQWQAPQPPDQSREPEVDTAPEQKGGDPDAVKPAPELPYGDTEIFWDFVL